MRNLKYYCCFLFIVVFFQNVICQINKETLSNQKIIYKDLNQIDLKDLRNEGAVGELLMLAREVESLDSTFYYKQKALQQSIKNKEAFLKPYILYHLGYTKPGPLVNNANKKDLKVNI